MSKRYAVIATCCILFNVTLNPDVTCKVCAPGFLSRLASSSLRSWCAFTRSCLRAAGLKELALCRARDGLEVVPRSQSKKSWTRSNCLGTLPWSGPVNPSTEPQQCSPPGGMRRCYDSCSRKQDNHPPLTARPTCSLHWMSRALTDVTVATAVAADMNVMSHRGGDLAAAQ